MAVVSNAVFSDSWFRIASARVALLASTKVDRQHFAGQLWYVLQDTFSHRFFRITPQAYAFLARLTPERTVEETWLAFVAEQPDQAPGQEDIVRVLSQLHVANMLYFDEIADNQAIAQRSHKQRRRELQSKLMGFLYVRVFLFDPDRWLDRIGGAIRLMTSPAALLLWLAVVLAGASAAIGNWNALSDHSQGLFSLSNLPLLFISVTGMKLIHETAHAFICKRYGGKVNGFGVMFLILTPLPYVDMAAAWSLKNRFHRALVGAAGMMAELFLAAIGALVWSQTSAGIINSLAFNVMVVGSVSSLLFNGNPLMRFDAYYILTDLIDIPNLYQKAQQHWLYLGDRYLLRTEGVESPANNRRELWWFTGYGFVTFFYRITVSAGIALFVMDQWFLIGVIMAVITIATMFLMPARRLLTYLNSPKVQKNRRHAVGVVGAIALAVLAFGQFVPFSNAIRAHGVLQAYQSAILHASSEGKLVQVLAQNGQMLLPGDVIAVLINPELDYELTLARQQYRELEMQSRQSLLRTQADTAPLEQRMQALTIQIQELDKLEEKLTVRAPHAGQWVAPGLQERQGNWLPRGYALGELVKGDRFRFVAVVAQEQADELFKHQARLIKLRLAGQSELTLELAELTLIPYQREHLASSALGFAGGGEIAVKPGDQSGEASAEPFFELHALLPSTVGTQLHPLHGLTGVMRIALPGVPLFQQARKGLMQLFQKRYGL